MKIITVIVATHQSMSTSMFLKSFKSKAAKQAPHLQCLSDIEDRIERAKIAQLLPTDPIIIKQIIPGSDNKNQELHIIMLGGVEKGTKPNLFAAASEKEETFNLATHQLQGYLEEALNNEKCESLILIGDWNLFFTGQNICSTAAYAKMMTTHAAFSKKSVVFCVDGSGNSSADAGTTLLEQASANKITKKIMGAMEEKASESSLQYVLIQKGDKPTNKDAAKAAIESVLRNAGALNVNAYVTDSPRAWDVVTKATQSPTGLKEHFSPTQESTTTRLIQRCSSKKIEDDSSRHIHSDDSSRHVIEPLAPATPCHLQPVSPSKRSRADSIQHTLLPPGKKETASADSVSKIASQVSTLSMTK